jgi:hypothetical protein
LRDIRVNFVYKSKRRRLTTIWGSVTQQHGVSSGSGRRRGFWIWRVTANTSILDKQSRTAYRGW